MKRSLHFILAFLALLCCLPAKAEVVSIPEHPASIQFGPLTVQYPPDWVKKNPRVGEGVALASPQTIHVADIHINLIIGLGKRTNAGKNFQQYKEALNAMMNQQIQKLNDNIQKQTKKVSEETGISIQVTEKGQWSLETENHGDVDMLRSNYVGNNVIDGKSVPFHTQGVWHVASDAVYNVIFTYPVSLESECGPFAEWLLKHVSVTP